MLHKGKYDLMSDRELVDGLIAVPVNNKLHEYFFKEKCRHFLTYISNTLYNDDNFDMLVGELYEFLSGNNWKILKMWEGKNGCSLNSYLASCSMRYFVGKVKSEKQRRNLEVAPSPDEIVLLLTMMPNTSRCGKLTGCSTTAIVWCYVCWLSKVPILCRRHVSSGPISTVPGISMNFPQSMCVVSLPCQSIALCLPY